LDLTSTIKSCFPYFLLQYTFANSFLFHFSICSVAAQFGSFDGFPIWLDTRILVKYKLCFYFHLSHSPIFFLIFLFTKTYILVIDSKAIS